MNTGKQAFYLFNSYPFGSAHFMAFRSCYSKSYHFLRTLEYNVKFLHCNQCSFDYHQVGVNILRAKNYEPAAQQYSTMLRCSYFSKLSTILNNIVEAESSVTMLFNVVGNLKQCGPHNIVMRLSLFLHSIIGQIARPRSEDHLVTLSQ